VSATITIVESTDRQLAAMVRSAGMIVASTLPPGDLSAIDRQSRPPDVLLLDIRGQSGLPPGLAALKRRHPSMGVVIVAPTLDPALMLEAMRSGVNEFVTEPVTPADLKAGIERVLGQQSAPTSQGQVLAFVGAKGGVGTTTIAVNVAVALANEQSAPVLMTDLHVSVHGDAALLLGVEPRFSVVDAIENTNRLDAAYLKGLVVKSKVGLDVLASPDRPLLRPPDAAQVRALLDRLTGHYGSVVLDVPRTDFGLLDALEPITAVALVVNQELPTIRRAAQIAALLRQRYGKDKVATVVSRYDSRADIGQEDIERVVGLPVWAVLPSDYRKVIAAANAGRPLVSDNHSRLASSVVQLAHRLASLSGGDSAKRPPAKPAGRLGGLF
jgi:pilus assembly protein CpaE